MKVRLLSGLASPVRDVSKEAGEIWECDDAEGERLIERGIAETIETTAEAPPENAMRPKVRARVKKETTDA